MIRNYREAEHPLLYGASHSLLRVYEHFSHDIQVKGKENIPQDTGAVLAVTHRDGYDPIGAGTAYTRPVFYMTKEELWTDEYDFQLPLPFVKVVINAGAIAAKYGAFPVRRGDTQKSTMRRARDIAKNGGVVGVFPEMTRFEDEINKVVRGRELGYLEPGTATIARLENVPISPMGLCVRKEVNKKGKARVVRVAAVIKDCILPVDDPEMRKKDRDLATMKLLRPILQKAHDEAYDLAA